MFEKENDKQHDHHHRQSNGLHRRNWMRHTATVPKGFIRFQVLGALNEKPMSGSELMEQIEKYAGGFWKPSPGSIYPLLAWLQDSGYIKELPTENGMKRHELTDTGKSLLDEQRSVMKKFKETMGFPQPPFSNFFTKVQPEKAAKIRDTIRHAGIAMFLMSSALQENFSEQALDEAIKAVEEAAEKLEEVTKKIKGESKNE
jgi:DNA-binding PadR family transcriptional regulator